MNQERIQQALILLERAKRLLQDNPNSNVKKSQNYLLETIRCLKESN